MLGTDVLYRLSDRDAQAINKRRDDFAKATAQQSALIGNSVQAGQMYAAKVVRVWNENTVNLQVYLDGNDIYWATSAMRGDGLSQWNFVGRV